MDWWLTLSDASGTKIPGNGPGGAILTLSFGLGHQPKTNVGMKRVSDDGATVLVKHGNWIAKLYEAFLSGKHLNGFLEAHTDSQRFMVVFKNVLIADMGTGGDGLWSFSILPDTGGSIESTMGPRIEKVMAAAVHGLTSSGARFLKK